MKRFVALLLAVLMIFSLCACGKKGGKRSSVPDALVGSWEEDQLFTVFPIAALDIESDGSVTLHMDHTYTGYITAKGGKYEITVDGYTGSAAAGITVEEVKKAYKISAELSDDEKVLTVFVKAKSGYYYLGDEAVKFKKSK